MTMKKFWFTLSKTFEEYFVTCTIHGFRYFSECKKFIEKVVWLLIVGFSFGYALYMVHTSLCDSIYNNPILTTLETTDVTHVPFPAITIRHKLHQY